MVEQQIGPESRPWQPLEQAFLARVQASAAVSAAEVWRLFAADAWFRQQLETKARQALGARARDPGWLGDVMHETLLDFEEQLAKSPDLGVDFERVDETFPGWIGSILGRACKCVVRRLLRLQRLQQYAAEEVPDPHGERMVDLRIDLLLAMAALEEPYRKLLRLSALGYSIEEIAERAGMSYWETHRRVHAGLAQLGRLLASYQRPQGGSRSSSPIDSSTTMSR